MDFLLAALANTIGSAIGVFFAITASQVIIARNTVRERRKVVMGLRAAVSHNQGLLVELTNQFNATNTPTFGLDLTFMVANAQRKHDVGVSFECCQSLDAVLYELQHLDTQVAALRQIWEINPQGSTEAVRRYAYMVKVARAQIVVADKHISAALTQLQSQDLRLPTLVVRHPRD